MHDGFRTLLDTSMCHDAWLKHMVRKLPGSVSLVSTFPGLLVSDIMNITFPGWLIPILKIVMWPLADTQRTMGIHHASILAAPIINSNRVSCWVSPLLEAHETNAITNVEKLGKWTYEWLEELIESKKARRPNKHA
mmetsp:Transcript_12532/g.18405  ORF Transcript_12532/g.18405 Transcript_12532/m.18405 type:complete len:136 (+) Transcript_12532:2099-2506(+)